MRVIIGLRTQLLVCVCVCVYLNFPTRSLTLASVLHTAVEDFPTNIARFCVLFLWSERLL